MATIITGEHAIANARYLTLRVGLELECLGMKKRGKSCYSIIKSEFGLTGNRVNVYSQFTSILRDRGVIA